MAKTYSNRLIKINASAKSMVLMNKKSIIVNCILFILGGILMGLDSEYFSPLGAICCGIGFVCSINSIVSVFKDMYSKQNADVVMSLPLTKKEHFLSKLLAIFYIHTLPAIIGGIFCIGLAFLTFPLKISDINDILKLAWIIINISLFIYAITIFCCCCCGRIAESAYTSVIFIGILTFVPYLFISSVLSKFSGLGYSNLDNDSFLNYWGFGFIVVDSDFYEKFNVWYMLLATFIYAAIIFASYFIFKNRDCRHTGKPIYSKLFFEIMMISGVFLIIVFNSEISQIGIGIVISAVIYTIINIIVSKGKINLKKIIGWVAKYCLTLASIVILLYASYMTNGFNYIKLYKLNAHNVKNETFGSNVDITMESSKSASSGINYIYNNESKTNDDAQKILNAIEKYQNSFDKNFDDFWYIINENNYESYDYSSYDDYDGYYNIEISISRFKIISTKNEITGRIDTFTEDTFYAKFSKTTSLENVKKMIKYLQEEGIELKVEKEDEDAYDYDVENNGLDPDYNNLYDTENV